MQNFAQSEKRPTNEFRGFYRKFSSSPPSAYYSTCMHVVHKVDTEKAFGASSGAFLG